MRQTSRARFVLPAAGILFLALCLRGFNLTADPPTSSVGIVWHDEGSWVHNARNAALWDTWRTDEWNPVFIAPVFTALEYLAFESLGVGTWQARVVPVLSGMVALVFMMAGLRALGGDRAALVGGVLLATEYTWVMWNRAALMESTMTALMVVAWAAYAMSSRRPLWAVVAGVAATLAFFTKAAAAFFIAAIVLDAVATMALAAWTSARARLGIGEPEPRETRAAAWMLGGLAISAALIALVFVAPNWTDFQFYNWQMSVARKPTYTLSSFIDRATWLPIVQDFFTRLWPLLVIGVLALLGVVTRWFVAPSAERLLVLWMLIGCLELVVHDAGNERRYVMFIPAVVALASLAIARGSFEFIAQSGLCGRILRWVAVPVVLLIAYLAAGSLARLVFAADIEARDYRAAVRSSLAIAALAALTLAVGWAAVTSWLARRRLSAAFGVAVVAATVAWNGWQYARWVTNSGDLNYRASIALGAAVPEGTTIHGKLANGMSLENRIRPIFVGRDFGNYADRLSRDDVRYILTYELPREGHESQPGLIREILDRYPQRRVIAAFDVDETPGPDRAVLIEKQPRMAAAGATGTHRARD